MYEDKTHHINDKILKLVANSVELILNESGIEGKILNALPTEHTWKLNQYRMDYVCKMSDGVTRDLEFQKTKPDKEDLNRFITYNGILFFENGADSEIIIIALYPTENEVLKIRINEYTTITFRVICLKHINGDDKLERITNKINNKIPLNKRDIDYMKLMPLLKTTKPSEEVLEDLIHLTNKVKLKTKEYREIKALQHLYVVKLIENKIKREKLIQVINMKVGLLDDAINIGIKEGKEEGIKEERLKIAKLMKSNGAPIEEISTYTNLSKTEIKKLS